MQLPTAGVAADVAQMQARTTGVARFVGRNGSGFDVKVEGGGVRVEGKEDQGDLAAKIDALPDLPADPLAGIEPDTPANP